MTKDDIKNNLRCALEYTVEVWEELARTGGSKDDLIGVSVNPDELAGRCGLCEYFKHNNYTGRCTDCCDMMDWSKCNQEDSIYRQWNRSDLGSSERKNFAKQMADKTKIVLKRLEAK